MEFITNLINQILGLIRSIFSIFGLETDKVPGDVE